MTGPNVSACEPGEDVPVRAWVCVGNARLAAIADYGVHGIAPFGPHGGDLFVPDPTATIGRYAPRGVDSYDWGNEHEAGIQWLRANSSDGKPSDPSSSSASRTPMTSASGFPIDFDCPAHPGELLGEYLDARAWSQSDLARRTGLTPKTISEIRNGKAPVSPSSALALEAVLGRPAHFWLGVQRVFDEAQARARRDEEAASWTPWAKTFPLKALRELKFIEDDTSDVDSLLRFLGVSSPDSWNAVWKASAVAYRQTHSSVSPAIEAWVRATELNALEVAEELPVAPYSEDALREAIPDLRSLTRQSVGAESLLSLQLICAAAGVIVVFVPELGPTGISGCARWLSRSRALVALTFRFKTDDHLWFTLFHEIGHVLLHRGVQQFLLDDTEHVGDLEGVNPELRALEEQANGFARDTLIPPGMLAQFVRSHPVVDSDDISQFAREIGIGPGVVVGRLQHDGVLDWHQGNSFKQKLDFSVK